MKKKEPVWNGEPFLIGEYQLGYRMVNLWALPEHCGGKYEVCSNKKPAKIEVGMDYNSCDYAYGVLCHEVWELAMQDQHVAFKPVAFEMDASDLYHFMFNHNQHTEICSKASWFIFKCHNDFVAAFKKCQKFKKKNRYSK